MLNAYSFVPAESECKFCKLLNYRDSKEMENLYIEKKVANSVHKYYELRLNIDTQ